MSRYLYLDFETTSVNPEVASVLELAYLPEVDGFLHDSAECLVQPVIHNDDRLYGNTPILEFIRQYNEQTSREADELDSFAFDSESAPLFMYTKSNLTYNMPPGTARDPSEWLTNPRREFPEVAIEKFLKHLKSLPGWGRWTMVGYNVMYDYNVLTYWFRRVLGDDRAREELNIFSYNPLDVYGLVRWFGYGKKMKDVKNQKLTTIADALGIPEFKAHTALADIEATYATAKILLAHINKVETE